MLDVSSYCLLAAAFMVGVAFVAYVLLFAAGRSDRHAAHAMSRDHELVAVGAAGGAGGDPAGSAGGVGYDAPASPDAPRRAPHGLVWLSGRIAELGLLLLTVSLVTRALATGHGPFANQHEFAVSFAWGVLAAHTYFERRYQVRAIALLTLPVATAMLLYALAIDSDAEPLVPALQNHLLLSLHVATAVLAYGAAAVAFAAAVLYLVQPRLHVRGLPRQHLLDEIGYRAAILCFPLMTIMIILGAIWADIAWGRYWSWDPKETASLVTWLIYGAYLHARVVRDWRGRRAAWLLILGFVAVLFTYFGNLFFGGLHAYA